MVGTGERRRQLLLLRSTQFNLDPDPLNNMLDPDPLNLTWIQIHSILKKCGSTQFRSSHFRWNLDSLNFTWIQIHSILKRCGSTQFKSSHFFRWNLDPLHLGQRLNSYHHLLSVQDVSVFSKTCFVLGLTSILDSSCFYFLHRRF